jgi:hypothetical protein
VTSANIGKTIKRQSFSKFDNFSRYCELCGLSEKIEQGLNKGDHQFLPKLAEGEETPFSPKCGKIGANTYDFKRSISLPGRKELEDKIKQKINGVDAEIKKRLNKGVISSGSVSNNYFYFSAEDSKFF